MHVPPWITILAYQICIMTVGHIKPVSNIEGGEEVIEALAPHVPGVQNDDTEDISNKSEDTSA